MSIPVLQKFSNIRVKLFKRMKNSKRYRLLLLIAIVVLILFLLGCKIYDQIRKTGKEENNRLSSSIPQLKQTGRQGIDDVPLWIDQNKSLTTGEFIWLLMRDLDSNIKISSSMDQAIEVATLRGYIPEGMNTTSQITTQNAAVILDNTKKNIKDFEVGHYDWQVLDLNESDVNEKGALLAAYANGLLTTNEGYIHPQNKLILKDAKLLITRLQDPKQRIYPVDCNAPYFEYDGMVELIRLDPTFVIDLKYATTDNFTGVQHYHDPVCLLDVDIAQKLVKANNRFKKDGYTIKIWDAYRPVETQWSLYYATPDNLKEYAPAPSKYSQHSKGIAVDITLVDKSMKEIAMPTKFDDFTIKAHIDYNLLPEDILRNRKCLISGMKSEGFDVNNMEWWHYYSPDKTYLPISKVKLSEFIKFRDEYYMQYIQHVNVTP